MVSVRRVLEALVAVNDQSGHVFLLGKGFGERLYNQFVVVMFAEGWATISLLNNL
ncbi:hypothetical protein [Paenibacillus polymyxa]|uniref:hypothetical protein n=1 Tax=Paenibacillus polymyxa TaxID=1406 RepID=UPI002025AB88|nr:hypothetical protein [Paenibacillus polymyxa]URJ49064.3 hypothetical protein MF626_003367 [Paenibacillus polymyxa]